MDAKYEGEKALYTWKSIYLSGRENPNNTQTSNPMPDDVAVLMYTSGSTGNPKGVMLTHQNLVSSVLSLCGFAEASVGKVANNDVYIGYLPLAHVLELLAENVMLLMGIGIGYSSPNSLTDNSTLIIKGEPGDATLLKPTIMTAVPVILDKIYKGIKSQVAKSGAFKSHFVDFCLRYRATWVRRGYDTPIMNRFVFSNFKGVVGGRVRLMLSGGAPLAEEAHHFIRTALCIQLHQGSIFQNNALSVRCANLSITHRLWLD